MFNKKSLWMLSRSLLILLDLSRMTACVNVTTDSSAFDVFTYVNQLIGTDNGGEQDLGLK